MTSIDYSARREKLLATVDADVVAIVPGANMVYFTGLHYHLSERPTVCFLHAEGISFVVPQLEVTKFDVRDDLDVQAFVWSDADGYEAAFKSAVNHLDLANQQMAVDGMTMRVFEWLAFAQAGATPDNALDAGQALLGLRAIKSPYEIDLMQAAINLSEEALKNTIDWVEVGMTEREISNYLADQMTALGTEGVAFFPLVLTGDKSALPHGNTADRPLGEDDFLLIDFGGKKGGYPADITRTFCFGDPTMEMREIYEAVRHANEAAKAVAKPGMTCHEVDKAARDVIANAGFGDYFTHRLGHGLGLEVHELPNIAPNNETVLQEGMVFTIEPGIYLPDVGGVRIEDDVVVTADGVRSLTSFPRNM